MRGIAYYYEFIGNEKISALAAEIRDNAIKKNRPAFKLRDFYGVDQRYINILKDHGTTDINQMIDNGNTPEKRKRLSVETNIPIEAVLDLVKLSNLARLYAVKGIRSRLYVNAGLDTWDKMA